MIKATLLKIIAFVLSLIDRLLFVILKILFGKEILPADLRGKYDHLESYTVEVDDPNKKPGETNPRRRVGYEKELISTPIPGVDTLNGLLDHVTKQFGNLPMLGTRPFKQKTIEKVDGKDWEVFHFNEIEYETYNQVYSRIMNLSRGLARFTGLNSKDFFGIFEETRKEWLMTLHACMRYNITVMTVYATLGDESLIEAVNECELSAMLVNVSSLKKLAYQIIPNTPSLKHLIYTSAWESKKEEVEKHIAELEKLGVSVMSFEEVEALGKQETNPIPVKEQQTTDSLCAVMYTSGTTSSIPKGVKLHVRNILAIAVGAREQFGLPDLKNPILCGVPRVYDTIKKGVSEKIKCASPVVQWLFKTAYDCKLNALKNGRDTPLFNFLVFRKIKKMSGGRMVGCLSGGSGISKESQEFFRVCFGAATFQGYGLTETSAAGVILMPEARFQTNVAGVVVPCVEVKLISVPHLNYIAEGKTPRGEIAIRGNAVSSGYYKQPEKTKEAFLDDGYFLTGDVGQFNEDGTLSIIDRVKNLVKLSHGEYIALERLESIYGGSAFVAPNGIMVYGDNFASFPIAIVIAQPGPTKRFAEENGITGTFSEICKHPKVQKQVLKSLEEQAKNYKLLRYEEIKDVRVFDHVWSPENDLLTAAFKLKRNNIVKKYRTELDEMYQTTQ